MCVNADAVNASYSGRYKTSGSAVNYWHLGGGYSRILLTSQKTLDGKAGWIIRKADGTALDWYTTSVEGGQKVPVGTMANGSIITVDTCLTATTGADTDTPTPTPTETCIDQVYCDFGPTSLFRGTYSVYGTVNGASAWRNTRGKWITFRTGKWGFRDSNASNANLVGNVWDNDSGANLITYLKNGGGTGGADVYVVDTCHPASITRTTGADTISPTTGADTTTPTTGADTATPTRTWMDSEASLCVTGGKLFENGPYSLAIDGGGNPKLHNGKPYWTHQRSANYVIYWLYNASSPGSMWVLSDVLGGDGIYLGPATGRLPYGGSAWNTIEVVGGGSCSTPSATETPTTGADTPTTGADTPTTGADTATETPTATATDCGLHEACADFICGWSSDPRFVAYALSGTYRKQPNMFNGKPWWMKVGESDPNRGSIRYYENYGPNNYDIYKWSFHGKSPLPPSALGSAIAVNEPRTSNGSDILPWAGTNETLWFGMGSTASIGFVPGCCGECPTPTPTTGADTDTPTPTDTETPTPTVTITSTPPADICVQHSSNANLSGTLIFMGHDSNGKPYWTKSGEPDTTDFQLKYYLSINKWVLFGNYFPTTSYTGDDPVQASWPSSITLSSGSCPITQTDTPESLESSASAYWSLNDALPHGGNGYLLYPYPKNGMQLNEKQPSSVGMNYRLLTHNAYPPYNNVAVALDHPSNCASSRSLDLGIKAGGASYLGRILTIGEQDPFRSRSSNSTTHHSFFDEFGVIDENDKFVGYNSFTYSFWWKGEGSASMNNEDYHNVIRSTQTSYTSGASRSHWGIRYGRKYSGEGYAMKLEFYAQSEYTSQITRGINIAGRGDTGTIDYTEGDWIHLTYVYKKSPDGICGDTYHWYANGVEVESDFPVPASGLDSAGAIAGNSKQCGPFEGGGGGGTTTNGTGWIYRHPVLPVLRNKYWGRWYSRFMSEHWEALMGGTSAPSNYGNSTKLEHGKASEVRFYGNKALTIEEIAEDMALNTAYDCATPTPVHTAIPPTATPPNVNGKPNLLVVTSSSVEGLDNPGGPNQEWYRIATAGPRNRGSAIIGNHLYIGQRKTNDPAFKRVDFSSIPSAATPFAIDNDSTVNRDVWGVTTDGVNLYYGGGQAWSGDFYIVKVDPNNPNTIVKLGAGYQAGRGPINQQIMSCVYDNGYIYASAMISPNTRPHANPYASWWHSQYGVADAQIHKIDVSTGVIVASYRLYSLIDGMETTQGFRLMNSWTVIDGMLYATGKDYSTFALKRAQQGFFYKADVGESTHGAYSSYYGLEKTSVEVTPISFETWPYGTSSQIDSVTSDYIHAPTEGFILGSGATFVKFGDWLYGVEEYYGAVFRIHMTTGVQEVLKRSNSPLPSIAIIP
jgi:hypothetical protein